MKKVILMVSFVILITFSAIAYSSYVKMHIVRESEPEAWQEAYTTFLKDFSAKSNYDNHEFSLRDLDNNGIPELIIIQTHPAEELLTVYSYDRNVREIGDYSNVKIAMAGLRISNNPMFPGLFTVWWGGGVEHYGYLTVKEGVLTYEDVWRNDHTLETPFQEEISNNKQLIKESIDAHPPSEYTDNLLKTYPFSNDAIDELFGDL